MYDVRKVFPIIIIGEAFCMGYAKSFLYNRGDILHGGTQNFSYIVGENTMA